MLMPTQSRGHGTHKLDFGHVLESEDGLGTELLFTMLRNLFPAYSQFFSLPKIAYRAILIGVRKENLAPRTSFFSRCH